MAYIALNKAHYFHNLALLSEKLGSVEKLAVVLKDNAYGHGLREIAQLAAAFGVKKAVVKNHQEAKQIAHLFPFILILMPDMQEADAGFSLVINSLDALALAPKEAKVHLKIDSGMHRNGIELTDLEEAFIMIEKRGLVLEGIMTHFRAADVLSCELFWQMKNWEEIKRTALVLVKKYTFQKPLFHAANSAALLRVADFSDDFARCGIASYGYDEFDAGFKTYDLKPVLTLWAEKIVTRSLKKDAKIGYAGVGKLADDGLVSTYDIGYGDGYFRYDGEGDLKTVEGLKIIGRVSMDNVSVEGDKEKVALFNDAKALAHYHVTISYDVLVKLSPTLKRRCL